VPVLHRFFFSKALCTWLSRHLLIPRIELSALLAPYRAGLARLRGFQLPPRGGEGMLTGLRAHPPPGPPPLRRRRAPSITEIGTQSTMKSSRKTLRELTPNVPPKRRKGTKVHSSTRVRTCIMLNICGSTPQIQHKPSKGYIRRSTNAILHADVLVITQ
jgi:hypothetical protein